MKILGVVVFLLFVFWSIMTIFIVMTIDDMYSFMRSFCFIILCVGYIGILILFTFYKKVRREDEYEYY